MREYLEPGRCIDSDHPALVEFDGLGDSVFHPFDQQSRRYMEYLIDHGRFADVPQELFFGHLAAVYSHLFGEDAPLLMEDFQGEAPH